MMHRALYHSPLGVLTLGSNGLALTSLQFAVGESSGSARVFEPVFRWLDAYFAGQSPESELTLAPAGTPFQLRVWRECCRIPHGCTCSYAELAQSLGCPGAARAVGSALARNPLLIVIPCHRVIPKSGGIGRYSAGTHLKNSLLQLEKSNLLKKS